MLICATKARELAKTANGKLLLEDYENIEKKIEECAMKGEFQCIYHCKALDFNEVIETLKNAGYKVNNYIKGLVIEWYEDEDKRSFY